MSDRLRAPTEDGGRLAVPPLEQAATLLAHNRQQLSGSGLTLLGQPLAQVRAEARRYAFAASDHYHWEQGEPVAERADGSCPVVVSGHQPELFHPGVWVKNFVLAHLARQVGGLPLHLLVDSDTLKTTALRVPHPEGHLRTIPFDHWTGETPWEDRRVLDAATFAAFGPEVLSVLAHWGYQPLLADVWPRLQHDVLAESRPLGEAFSRARRHLERSWGVSNREVPLSRLWSTRAFARLAGVVLADLPRFHAVHNAAVSRYRVQHGIRSRNHPVPDLEVRSGFHEAPFWAYAASQRRQRLRVRCTPDALDLKFGERTGSTLPHPQTGEPFLRAWCGLAGQGLRVRSRALITTLAARLLLADLFIHGLGGGLYDALTDSLLREFFGIEPPGFLIVTATRLLPLPRSGSLAAAAAVVAEQRRLIRDLRYNPHRFRHDAASESLLAERQHWIAQQPTTRAERRERFRQLRRVKAALSEPLADQLAEAEVELQHREAARQRAQALGRRDFSFVLFPEATLRPFLSASPYVS